MIAWHGHQYLLRGQDDMVLTYITDKWTTGWYGAEICNLLWNNIKSSTTKYLQIRKIFLIIGLGYIIVHNH